MLIKSLEAALRSKLLRILGDYKSTKKMQNGNNMILKILRYDQTPELSRAFCLGIIFIDIVDAIETYSYPKTPDDQTMQESLQMFLDFSAGKYED